jgi:hypothetical protein
VPLKADRLFGDTKKFVGKTETVNEMRIKNDVRNDRMITGESVRVAEMAKEENKWKKAEFF